MNWHISCVNSYMKLYIISNRLPVKVTKEDETFVFSRSEGGLATGLDSLQISYEKHWIGWPGICVDNEESKEEITSRLEGINFHPVFLSEIQIKNYYEGYSNSTIWPLCHYFFVVFHPIIKSQLERKKLKNSLGGIAMTRQTINNFELLDLEALANGEGGDGLCLI